MFNYRLYSGRKGVIAMSQLFAFQFNSVEEIAADVWLLDTTEGQVVVAHGCPNGYLVDGNDVPLTNETIQDLVNSQVLVVCCYPSVVAYEFGVNTLGESNQEVIARWDFDNSMLYVEV